MRTDSSPVEATLLVAGAGGFVGSAVVRALVARLRTGTPLALPGGRVVTQVLAVVRDATAACRLDRLAPHPCWQRVGLDLDDPDALRAVLRARRPGAVLDLAAGQGREPTLRALVQESGDLGARYVHTSSAWVLPAGGALGESVEPDPRLPYAREKLRDERLLTALAPSAGLSWVNLRLFYIFGRHEASRRLLPSLVTGLRAGRVVDVSDAHRVRDFTDVDRVAAAYLGALTAPESASNRSYHIGSGAGITLREFASTVADVVGGHALVRYGSLPTPDGYLDRQVADPADARRALGWDAPADARPDIRSVTRWWLDRLAAGQPEGTRTPWPA